MMGVSMFNKSVIRAVRKRKAHPRVEKKMHTLFFGFVSDNLVIVWKIGGEVALEASRFLGPELAARLSARFLCAGHVGLEPIQLVFDAIDDFCLVFCDVGVCFGRRQTGPVARCSSRGSRYCYGSRLLWWWWPREGGLHLLRWYCGGPGEDFDGDSRLFCVGRDKFVLCGLDAPFRATCLRLLLRRRVVEERWGRACHEGVPVDVRRWEDFRSSGRAGDGGH